MLLHNLRLLTFDPEQPYLDDGAVRVEGNTIRAAGSAPELLEQYPDVERVDLEGRLVMPGLINAHTHCYSAYARGMGNSRPTRDFLEILENLWWALDKQLTLEDVRLNALNTMIESVKNGVTAIVDHHASPNAVAGSLEAETGAAIELGIRADICYELSDRDGKEIRDLGVAENRDFFLKLKREPQELLRAHFGLHAPFTLSDETLEKVKDVVDEYALSIHCHVAEGLADQLDSVREHGMRTIERLERFGLLDPKAMVIHLCHVNHREMDIIKEYDAIAVTNPQSNMGNAVGSTPVVELLKRGILLGLGTDAYTHDMFVSDAALKTLVSHELADPTKGFGEAYQLLYENNPKILGRFFDRTFGVIKEGAAADLISIDYTPYTPFDAQSAAGHLIFGMTGRMVNDTMINGRFIRCRSAAAITATIGAFASRTWRAAGWRHRKKRAAS